MVIGVSVMMKMVILDAVTWIALAWRAIVGPFLHAPPSCPPLLHVCWAEQWAGQMECFSKCVLIVIVGMMMRMMIVVAVMMMIVAMVMAAAFQDWWSRANFAHVPVLLPSSSAASPHNLLPSQWREPGADPTESWEYVAMIAAVRMVMMTTIAVAGMMMMMTAF
jgi:hypothetical protein